jgi:hypothetical protein
MSLRKINGWYRDDLKPWELEIYGFYPRGLGDLIFNNLQKIIEDDDKSDWARQIFDECTVLLMQNKRWPDEMNPSRMCKSKACSAYNKTKFQVAKLFNKDVKLKYRWQKDMTRDPWVIYYAACVHFDEREFIQLKPPWWLWRPTLWALRKAMLGKRNNYTFWEQGFKLFKQKDFVANLEKWRRWTYKQK